MKYDAPKEFKILSAILTSTGGNSTCPKVAVLWLHQHERYREGAS